MSDEQTMDETLYLRRVARAALEQAFTNAGIPADYMVLPQQDDHEKLIALPPLRVLWLGHLADDAIAEVNFESAYVGTVYVEDLNRISENRDFWPEDYGFERPFEAELKFDLTDQAETHHNAWRDLPKATLRKRPRMRPITITSSMGRVSIVKWTP